MLLEHSIEDTIATLDSCDRRAYRSLLEPLTGQFDQLIEEVLSPMWHLPRHPLLLARFAVSDTLVRNASCEVLLLVG